MYALDADAGWLSLEWVEGVVVREVLRTWYKNKSESEKAMDREDGAVNDLLTRVGNAVGALHRVGIVHGDLTTSNMMLRPRGRGRDLVISGGSQGEEEMDGEIVLIDFGLASQSLLDEDRAVDLYVLERAFGSTHPGAESSFWKVLEAYGQSYKGANVVIKKLEDVRMRGRKRSMIG